MHDLNIALAELARMVERAGEVVRLGFKVRPHALRHACGFETRIRYAGFVGLLGAQEHPAHSALHRIGAGSL
jgi:hypothetical protein